MADNGDRGGTPTQSTLDSRRRWLILPVAAVLTLMWIATGIQAVVTGDVNAFVIASGPFGLLCGYLFGVSLIRGTGGNG